MLEPSLPPDEADRLAALRSLFILDTPPEERFDRLTRLAKRLFNVPIALISLVDANRQWFKSRQGLSVSETPRHISFCGHAILQDEPLVIEDALLDPRFADNPLVTGKPHVRFYAGQPLLGPGNHKLGTLCIIDRQPRQMSPADLAALRDLAALAQEELNATELNQAYAVQRASEARIRAIMNSVVEALILVAPDQRFLSVNRQFEELFGVPGEQVLGRRFDELQSLLEQVFAEPAKFVALVEQVFAEPAKFVARVAGTSADANQQFTEIVAQRWPQPRELELFSTPVRSDGGEHLGRLYVFRDVTHERAVDRMKSELVSLVSHELRTPLTSIKGFTDLILDGDAGEINDEQREYLEIVRQSGDRLTALVNDLLDVARIEAGRVQLNIQPVTMAEIVQSVVTTLGPQIEAKGQSLTVEVEAALPPVRGDRDRLLQVLTNLLSNATKYTPVSASHPKTRPSCSLASTAWTAR
jgi:signal transduction histidine kinase